MRKDDRPVVYALLAVAVAFLLCAAVGAAKCQPTEGAPAAEQNCSDENSFAGVRVILLPFDAAGTLIYRHREVINAFSTLVIAAFTLTLFLATFGQLKHLRREFIATHRPRLRVRRVDQVQFAVNAPVQATITVANIGDTDASIEEMGLDIYPRDKANPLAARFNAIPRLMQLPPIPPGKQAVIRVSGGQQLSLNDINRVTLSGQADLCLLGIVNYTDANGVLRATSFFRIFDIRRGRFHTVPKEDIDADRDYED